eukprot:5090332-Alexandrium_andersonii.AAC.1
MDLPPYLQRAAAAAQQERRLRRLPRRRRSSRRAGRGPSKAPHPGRPREGRSLPTSEALASEFERK